MGRISSPEELRQITEQLNPLFHRTIDNACDLADEWLSTGYNSSEANQLQNPTFRELLVSSAFYADYQELITAISSADTISMEEALNSFKMSFFYDPAKQTTSFNKYWLITRLNNKAQTCVNELKFTYEEQPLATNEPDAAKPATSEHQEAKGFSGLSMEILGGFMMIAGSAAVALAFVALSAATAGLSGILLAAAGTTAFLVGSGFFMGGVSKNHPSADHHPEAIYFHRHGM